MIPSFIRSYESSAVIGAYPIAMFSDAAASSKVAAASSATSRFAGTTGKVGASAAGAMVDLVKSGIGAVVLGGAVQTGDWLTSDANGAAIATTTAGNHVIGRAEQPGVAGDIIDYFAAPGVRA